MIGTRLAHYRIERLLGKGGMGDVYLAEDTKLGRQVALKVLSPELASDQGRRERFEREARAAASLNHPNIVTIHSVEEVDGVPFLTLELVEGQALGDIIPPEGLPLDRVLDLSIPLADAVGAAHQRGITHRDLKPANVMVTPDGRIKVLDFGLAKLKDELRAAEAAMPTTSLTGEGRIVGTVSYMSPEQAAAKPIDQRSDVFSLGVILYEMLTGVRPFQGDTQMSTLSAIIKDTPKPIADLRPRLPREVSRIVNRCLAKDVEDRYQSAKDLRNDLRALKNDLASGEVASIHGSRGHVAPTAARRRMIAIVVTAVVLGAILAVAALWPHIGGDSATASRPFDSMRLTRLTTSGSALQAALSLDGRYVAYVVSRDGKQSLWLRQIATTSNVPLVQPDESRPFGLTFAPDGNHVYYVDARDAIKRNLYQMPILGGGSRLILEGVDSPVTFSPDGKQLGFIRSHLDEGTSAVMLANIDGTNQRTLATRKRPVRFLPLGIAWSPDGLRIAATGGNNEDLRGEIVVVDVAHGTESRLPIPEWQQVIRLAWLPDGRSLLVNAQESAAENSTQIFVVSYPSGSARRLTSDLNSYSGLSVAPDGKSFVTIRNERRVTLWTVPVDDPLKAVAVTSDATGDEGGRGLAWVPDGRIVYTTETSGNPEIWIMNADGSRRVQLTTNPGQDVSPRVTPDGRQIVFVSDRDGRLRVWRMGLDGTGATRVSSDILGGGPAFISGDGQWIYYDIPGGEARRVSINGGQSEVVFSKDLLARLSEPLPPVFHQSMPSPDGSSIAGHYVIERGERMAVIPTAGGAMKRFEAMPTVGTWSPDGQAFVYVATTGGVSNLMRQPLSGGPLSPLTKFTSEQIFGYALSPDQKQVAVVRGRVSSDVVLVSDTR
jgi:serine/threonine protein kinase/Tol biopolymer transport system component